MMTAAQIREQERRKWQLQCYGCTEADLKQMVADAKEWCTEPTMLAMSILSDAQELLAMDSVVNEDRVRQYMNRAKWVIKSIHLTPKEEGR